MSTTQIENEPASAEQQDAPSADDSAGGMQLDEFQAMRMREHVRSTVTDTTDHADELLRDSWVLKTIVNEHFETQIALRNRSKKQNPSAGFRDPLIVYTAQSVLRQWSVPKPLDCSKPSERSLVPAAAYRVAQQMADTGALGFMLIVESIERKSHATTATTVCAARVLHRDGSELKKARKQRDLRRRINQLNNVTELTLERATTRCEDMQSRALLTRAQMAYDSFRASLEGKDAAEDGSDKKLIELEAQLEAAQHVKTQSDIELDSTLQLISQEALALQHYETNCRGQRLLEAVLTETDALKRVKKRVDDGESTEPLFCAVYVRNGCPMYGERGYKFADTALLRIDYAKCTDEHEMAFNQDLIKEAERRAKEPAGADALILVITEHGHGPLYGLMSRSFNYVPNVLAMADATEKQRAASASDRKQISALEQQLGAAIDGRKSTAANAPTDQDIDDEHVGDVIDVLDAERKRIVDEHARAMERLNDDYAKRLAELEERMARTSGDDSKDAEHCESKDESEAQ